MRRPRRSGIVFALTPLLAAAVAACVSSSPTPATPEDAGSSLDGATADVGVDATVGDARMDGPSAVDAGTDSTVAVDAGADSGEVDSGGDALDATAAYDGPLCEGTCGTSSCGSCPDASTAQTSDGFQHKTFDLDAYEVTNASYAAFLAVRVDPATQPPFCTWNTSFTPTVATSTAGQASSPAQGVDWCDAYAYCAWAGRRLCGNIAGGGNASAYYDNPDQDQWFHGCTGAIGGSGHAGYMQYPYGDTYDASTCNGAGYDAGAVIAVGSAIGCVGGIAGLFDMSGNVSEWEDDCTDGDQVDAGTDAGPLASCLRRGGSFQDDAGGLACESEVYSARTVSGAGIGFRCCSP